MALPLYMCATKTCASATRREDQDPGASTAGASRARYLSTSIRVRTATNIENKMHTWMSFGRARSPCPHHPPTAPAAASSSSARGFASAFPGLQATSISTLTSLTANSTLTLTLTMTLTSSEKSKTATVAGGGGGSVAVRTSFYRCACWAVWRRRNQ